MSVRRCPAHTTSGTAERFDRDVAADHAHAMTDVRCVRSGDLHLAYRTVGCGPTSSTCWARTRISRCCELPQFRRYCARSERSGSACAPACTWERSRHSASSTIRDLVAGSGITFYVRGELELKGVPDHWRILAVESSG